MQLGPCPVDRCGVMTHHIGALKKTGEERLRRITNDHNIMNSIGKYKTNNKCIIKIKKESASPSNHYV